MRRPELRPDRYCHHGRISEVSWRVFMLFEGVMCSNIRITFGSFVLARQPLFRRIPSFAFILLFNFSHSNSLLWLIRRQRM